MQVKIKLSCAACSVFALALPHMSTRLLYFLQLRLRLTLSVLLLKDGSDSVAWISALMCSAPLRRPHYPATSSANPSASTVYFLSLFHLHTSLSHIPSCCHSSPHSLRSPLRSSSCQVCSWLKIQTRDAMISSSAHHPSADRSLTHRLLIQGHDCYSLSRKGQLKLNAGDFSKDQELLKLPQKFLRWKALK